MRVEIERRCRVIEALLDYSEDATHSEMVDLEGEAIAGLIIPTIDTGNITFEVTHDKDVAPVALKTLDGNDVAITAGGGGFAVSASELDHLAGFRFVRIVTAGTQTADRKFQWVLKT